QELIARVRARVTFLYKAAEGLLPEPLPVATLTAAHFWRVLQQAAEVLPDLWTALGEVGQVEARDLYQALQLALQARMKTVHHLHATFASDAATVARLAARFADIPYSVTARAK